MNLEYWFQDWENFSFSISFSPALSSLISKFLNKIFIDFLPQNFTALLQCLCNRKPPPCELCELLQSEQIIFIHVSVLNLLKCFQDYLIWIIQYQNHFTEFIKHSRVLGSEIELFSSLLGDHAPSDIDWFFTKVVNLAHQFHPFFLHHGQRGSELVLIRWFAQTRDKRVT